MKRIYLAGPMTGYPELNFPVFHAEAARLSAAGLDVINPAEINPDQSARWIDCMRADVPQLLTCAGIHLLPGWEKSRGARLEYSLASMLEFEITLATGAADPRALAAMASAALHAVAQRHVEDYEFDAGEGWHTPSEFERLLIKDCVTALLEDEELRAALAPALLPVNKAPESATGDAVRFNAFVGTLLADINGEALTPLQLAIKNATSGKSQFYTLDALRDAIDAGLAKAAAATEAPV
jgi:hypothetical protein